ncbi:MAG: helix-turn-helix domain-containing protein [Clostridium saudiense]|uniref:helix-turn-helix domain-containing protein n=1 Tax=Clostridium saudiense TaxID=1414720 RepID=UPI003993080C
MRLSEKIKLYRKKNKMTKSELARLINVSPSYITKLENGEKENPSLEVKIKIANALGCSITELGESLFAGTGSMIKGFENMKLEDQRGDEFKRVADLFEEFDYQISEINDNNIDKVEISTFEDGTIMTLEENDFINLGNQLLDEINESIRLQIKQFIKRNE